MNNVRLLCLDSLLLKKLGGCSLICMPSLGLASFDIVQVTELLVLRSFWPCTRCVYLYSWAGQVSRVELEAWGGATIQVIVGGLSPRGTR